MIRSISTAALVLAAFSAGPAFAECGASHSQNSQLANPTQQMAQTRDRSGRDNETIREEENRRSGGTGAAPGTILPRGDGNSAQTPQSGTTGPGQNQGSPPGTSSGSGSSGAPSTTGNPNQGGTTGTGSGGTTGSGSGGTTGSGSGTGGGSGGSSGGGSSGGGGSGGGGSGG